MSSSPPDRQGPARGRVFAIVTLACIVLAGGYIGWAATRDRGSAGASSSDVRLVLPAVGASPTVVFQSVARDRSYAHVAFAAADEPEVKRATSLVCERVHVAGGRGLCLLSRQGLAGPAFTVKTFGSDFKVQHHLSLSGLISRARVSPDGRLGATTSFVAGHSYADAGQFSTETTLIDMSSGKKIGELEDFVVTRDGQVVRSADRNFWGVTFRRDSNRFYATMRTGGGTWLIEGLVDERRAHTLHANVECPSLSPDGTRIAYKKRVGGGKWRLHVLDLRTMRETALAETRVVDDQVEWLDDQTVLYGLEASVWATASDGSGNPRRLIADALSPAAVRAPAR